MINIKKIIVIGDRILIKPEEGSKRTSGGLYLPPGVNEKDKVQSGVVIKIGPGYPVPSYSDDDEPWKEEKKPVKYIPLQVKEGDFAIFLKKESVEVEVEKEKMLIVPQAAILLIYRDDVLLDL